MWLVVGAGYVGNRLVDRLAGERVLATARKVAPPGGMRFDDATDELDPGNATVVWLAPPGDSVARMAAIAAKAARFVYISTTGVYAPGGGAWVDEAWPLEPTTASGKRRLAAERALPATACVLRVPGIYGPGRGVEDRLRAGTYRVIGDGAVSRIHVDDLVTAIVAAGRSTIAGPINVADDDPLPSGELADLIADRIGLPHPPRVTSTDPEVVGMLTANRRIANARMKRELGVALAHPSARG